MANYRRRAKDALLTGAAAVLLLSAAAVQGEDLPGGSFRRSCTDVEKQDGSITAHCRRADGAWERSTLNDVDRCMGGLANIDGRLTCNTQLRSYGWDRDHDRDLWRGYSEVRELGRELGYGSSMPARDFPPSDYYSYGR
jgi:hypothetical protein